MKLRTLVIDDEPIALEKLGKYVEKVPFLELVSACESALDAIAVLNEKPVDLIFTDINMPDLNGMDFIASLSSTPMVVFITAYAQYAVDSYRLSAVDYLLKPYGFAEFQRAANKALEAYSTRRQSGASSQSNSQSVNDSLFVKVDYRYVRIRLASICYIKGYGEYLQIFTEGSSTPILTLSSFADIKERLSDNFLQVHRSYIVNMDQVESINRGRIIMDADTYIPVGDSFKNAMQSYLLDHSVGTPRK